MPLPPHLIGEKDAVNQVPATGSLGCDLRRHRNRVSSEGPELGLREDTAKFQDQQSQGDAES